MPSGYTDLLLPTLQQLHDGGVQSSQDLRKAVLAIRGEDSPNGTNWVAHCLVKLQEALLVSKVESGEYEITERGRQVLTTGVPAISLRTLEQFPEYVAAQRARGRNAAESRLSGIPN